MGGSGAGHAVRNALSAFEFVRGRIRVRFDVHPSLDGRVAAMKAGTTIEATFCFVDIAGYTALTDSHGGHAAADLVDQFADLVDTSVGASGRLQSLTGDCAFLIFPDPLAAKQALSTLYQAIADRRNFPIVRAGLHHGHALLRADRHFGSTVNIAARVAAQAAGGQILCTQEVADSLRQAQATDIAIEHLGSFALRNLPQSVDLYEIILSSCAREYAIDPVCKMQVDRRHAAGDLRFDKVTYWFCSLACVERFARDPSSYLAMAKQ
jgi:class 3 adenylate cyclase